MSRLLLLGLLPAFLCIACWSADLPGKVGAPVADVPVARTPVQALCKTVDYPGVEDPKTTLADELARLAKLSGVAIHVDERAFKYEQLMDILKSDIASARPLPPMRAPLAQVLQRVLERLPVPSGATYMVREDHIEITTTQFQNAEVPLEREQSPARPGAPMGPRMTGPLGGPIGPGGPGAPMGPGPMGPGPGAIGPPAGPGLPPGGFGVQGVIEEESKKINVAVVSVALDRQPLEEAVRQIRIQANASLVLDPALGEKGTAPLTVTLLNVPLDSALLVLGELADVDYVWLDNIFFVTTKDKADKLRAKWPNRRGGAGRPMMSPMTGGM
jgi:hypothetical protein